MKDLHEYSGIYWSNPSIAGFWNKDLAAKFLDLNPRPTVAELRKVLCPPGLVIGLTSQNRNRRRGYVPDPQKTGWLKYDEKRYIKILRWEARKRQELMQQIIEKRN